MIMVIPRWLTIWVIAERALASASSAVQLAVYRLAWAKLQAIAVEQVSAAFYYVPINKTDRRANLLNEDELTDLLLLK